MSANPILEKFLACKTQFLSISECIRNIAKYTQRMKAVKKAVFWWQKWCRNPVREEIFKKCTEYNLAENSSHISSDLHSDATLFKLSRPSNWKYCPLFKVIFSDVNLMLLDKNIAIFANSTRWHYFIIIAFSSAGVPYSHTDIWVTQHPLVSFFQLTPVLNNDIGYI